MISEMVCGLKAPLSEDFGGECLFSTGFPLDIVERDANHIALAITKPILSFGPE
jgi:hypothetical protein